MKKLFLFVFLFFNLSAINDFINYRQFATSLPEGVAISLEAHPYLEWHISWGFNEDIDPLSLPEDTWTYGGEYPFSLSNAVWYISSDNAADVGVVINMELLNSGFERIMTRAILSGQTQVQIVNFTGPNLFYRINHALNGSNIAHVGTVYIYEGGGVVTGGVPQDPLKVRGIILQRHQQMQQCIFTVYSNYTGHVRNLFANVKKGGGGNWANLGLQVRSPGGVFRTVGEAGVNDGGNGFFIYDIDPPAPLLPGTDIRFRVWDVESLNTQVGAGIQIIMAKKSDWKYPYPDIY